LKNTLQVKCGPRIFRDTFLSEFSHSLSLDASGGSVFRNLIHPAMLAWIRAAASTQTFGIMKILVPIVLVAAVICLRVILLRAKGARQEPTYATRDQIPTIVSKLQRTGRDGSFVVFMFSIPGNHDETLPNLQYSVENGQLGFDWVLIAPQNMKDETAVTDFIKRFGHTSSKREMNGVRYLRFEGMGVEDLGLKILQDFYHLPSDTKLELIVEGFDTKE
jgi:hypothetical protein